MPCLCALALAAAGAIHLIPMSATGSNSTAARAVAIVPKGWWDLEDRPSFYPDDLPEDWRLGYFANEHPGVYLPVAVWGTTPAATLRSWQHDVHRRFGFFLEHPPPTGGAGARPEPALEALGDNLVAWVRWGDTLAAPGALLAPWVAEDTRLRIGQALHCPQALLDDLRGGARWLRSHAAAAATLVVLPQPTAKRLAAWRELAALLGLAELSAPLAHAATRPA